MSDFELIVLGSSGTFPTPETASTGFLLKADDVSVWLDAGTGTFANLQKHIDYFDVDAVVISHLHLDHILDLYPFYYGLRYSINSNGSPTGKKIFAPKGAEHYLERLLKDDKDQGGFEGYLVFEEIAAGGELKVPPITFGFYRSLHPIETLAMRVEANGRTLGYTSDTGPTSDLIDCFKKVDVLIAEASMHEPDENLGDVHMTSEEAGKLAETVGAGKLVLTHISPGLDGERSIRDASKYFGGEVLLAQDHERIPV